MGMVSHWTRRIGGALVVSGLTCIGTGAGVGVTATQADLASKAGDFVLACTWGGGVAACFVAGLIGLLVAYAIGADEF